MFKQIFFLSELLPSSKTTTHLNVKMSRNELTHPHGLKSLKKKEQNINVCRQHNSSNELTWQCYALDLIRFTGVSLQFTFGHRVRLAEVEKGEPVPHGRPLSLSRRPLAAETQEQIIFNTSHKSKFPHTMS